MIHYGWPDIIILVSAILSAHRGWKLGFITELGGTIAIVAAVMAGFNYGGWFDDFIEYWTRLQAPSAHIFGLFVFALLVYGLIAMLAIFLNKYSNHVYVSPLNAIGGGLLGIFKALFMYWVILYVALFMPINRSLRSDLRNSFIVPLLITQSDRLDDRIRPATPWFARPFVNPYFRRHHL